MGRYAQDNGGGSFQQAPAGSHVAICIKLTDLGTQHGEYQGQPNTRNQVLVTWELPNEKMDDGKPFIVSNFYTNSLNEKATLRAHLESWRGRGFTEDEAKKFDLMNVLGKPCMISVIHTDKGKARVSGVMALPKGTTVPATANKPTAFWLDEFSPEEYEKVPEGIRKIIEKSDEWKAMQRPKPSAGDMKDDLPWRDDDPADDCPF